TRINRKYILKVCIERSYEYGFVGTITYLNG
ncbi:MAG: hypothetical protein ACI9DQ_001438, partial [Glaciecola sp.]